MRQQDIVVVEENDNKGVSKYLQHLRIEFDICLINKMCDFPAIPSPAQNHYSIVIFRTENIVNREER